MIASFGLVLDLIGFVLLLFFVLVSSVILLRREKTIQTPPLESGRYTGVPDCRDHWRLGRRLDAVNYAHTGVVCG